MQLFIIPIPPVDEAEDIVPNSSVPPSVCVYCPRVCVFVYKTLLFTR